MQARSHIGNIIISFRAFAAMTSQKQNRCNPGSQKKTGEFWSFTQRQRDRQGWKQPWMLGKQTQPLNPVWKWFGPWVSLSEMKALAFLIAQQILTLAAHSAAKLVQNVVWRVQSSGSNQNAALVIVYNLKSLPLFDSKWKISHI